MVEVMGVRPLYAKESVPVVGALLRERGRRKVQRVVRAWMRGEGVVVCQLEGGGKVWFDRADAAAVLGSQRPVGEIGGDGLARSVALYIREHGFETTCGGVYGRRLCRQVSKGLGVDVPLDVCLAGAALAGLKVIYGLGATNGLVVVDGVKPWVDDGGELVAVGD